MGDRGSARRPTSGAEPEKTTNQLQVWRRLIEELNELDTAWQTAAASGPSGAASGQLPANLLVELVRSTERATRVLAEIADVAVNQYDSGGAFRDVAAELARASQAWPTR
ncbi:hypothetical protein ACWGRK_03380 [Saccharomonospora azurea]